MATETQHFPQTTPAAPGNSRNSIMGMDPKVVANGLGWFSIGLGLTELLAPGAVGKITGLANHRRVIRSYGLRELSNGIGILSRPEAAAPLWTRVAGDVMDLASLGIGLTSSRNDRAKTLGSIAAVLGVTVLDCLCAQELSSGSEPASAHASMVVNRSPEACYRFWRDFNNLPRFMDHLDRVEATGDNRSHWTAKAPGGMPVEWDAEIRQDVPNQRIAWRSLAGSDISHAGAVEFEPAAGRRGTLVRLSVEYGKGGGIAGSFAKLLGKAPEQILQKELRRFKQLLETGEVITTEGQSAGRSNGATWLDNIAR